MKTILYAGDDTLTGAASYLGGMITHCKIPFDHVQTSRALTANQLGKGRKVLVLSDYPSKNISSKLMQEIKAQVQEGMGLFMVGGWESFYGAAGEYNATPIEEVLPVFCRHADDRANYCHGLTLEPVGTHPITRGLPFVPSPVLCGYNRILPKQNSQVILSLRPLKMTKNKVEWGKEKIPLLVLGQFGKGKTAAFASDFAPHWVGGLVDWGDKRIQAKAQGGCSVEVGENYMKLVRNIFDWFLAGKM